VSRRSRTIPGKADAAERRARLEAGELVEASAIAPAWLTVANTVRSRMLAIPTRLAARMVGLKTPAEAEDLLRKEVYAGLIELADPPRV
jgi:phage terminase Nu1 subunit (DNA packaging protein)